MSTANLLASFTAAVAGVAQRLLALAQHAPGAWHIALVAFGFAIGFFALRPTRPA